MPENISAVISEFERLIVWKVISGIERKTEVPEPQPGIDELFD